MTYHKPTKCALCSHEAVAIYYMDQGCGWLPDLTVQPLCEHHEIRPSPLGSMMLLKDLRIGTIDTTGKMKLDGTEDLLHL